jgi:hypothetical protein
MPPTPRASSCLARVFPLAWVVALVLGSGCAPRDPKSPSLAVEAVTFVKSAPKVGRIAIEENSIAFRLETEARARGATSARVRTESLEHERRREEIFAVFERIVTKKKITYEALERKETRNGTSVVEPPSPLAGRSYVVELKQSVPVFSDPSGAPVSDAEARELARRLGTFGKPDPFLEGIPDGPVHPGAPASGMAGGFLEIFEGSSHDGPDVGNVDVRFAGVRDEPQGRCGVFAFTMNVQVAGEPRMSLVLKGEFLVRISDGAPIRLEARGPAHLVGLQTIEGVNVQMSGRGEMQGALRVTYL